MLDIQSYIGAPKIYTQELSPYSMRFEVMYLPRSFGQTLGNALRRIMLGYDYGASITGFSIQGVSHEYVAIDGVKETVFDIMLRLKELRFIFDSGDDETMQNVKFDAKGLGVFDSSSIALPSGISLLSKDVELFTITDPKITITMTVRIEKGYGYYGMDYLTAREQQKEEKDVDFILIDNDFRVVQSLTYSVEEFIDDFAGGSKDKLTLDITMKYDSISAKDFLSFAGEVLASYGKLFIFEDAYLDKSMFVDYHSLDDKSQNVLGEENVKIMPIDALSLSERTRNALIKNDILYVEDLEKKKKGELLLMKGVGRKAVDEISTALASISKSLIG